MSIKRTQLALVAILCCGGLFPAVTAAQFEYTPDSPEVEQIVWKAVAFLRTTTAGEVGPQALRALAIAEANLRYHEAIPTDDPLIQRGVDVALAYTTNARTRAEESISQNPRPYERLYEAGVCAILLSLFGETHRDNLQAVVELIEARQQVGGSWGYQSDGVGQDYGDTSQMQYCCLALWVANRAGLQVNPQMAQRAIEWLFDTQTAGGGWRYRARRSGGGAGRTLAEGGGETLSLTAAGCGSVYMLADILGATNAMRTGRRPKSQGFDLPSIVQEFVPERDGAQQAPASESQYVSSAAVRNTTNRANTWFKQNFRPDAAEWQYYYLYGFERYAFFREMTDGEVTEIPNWYDQGVKYLMEAQQADGSFRGESGSETVSPGISTSFAILFLVRSTQILAKESAKGTLRGGQGFGAGSLSLRGGQVVNEQIAQNVEEFMQAIAAGKEVDLSQFTGSLSVLKVPTDPKERTAYMQQLRILVNDEDHAKRYVAVRYLGSVRELDNVPALIYALTDPVPEIIEAAHNGLRFISRKLDSVPFPTNPTPENTQAIRKQWEEWYLSVRPEGELMLGEDR